jgi:predicted ribosome quality control (RQC) complex YloA/Tae2 family protein
MVEDLTTWIFSWGNFLTVIVSTSVLAGVVWRAVDWLHKQQDIKAKELEELKEKDAEALRKYTDSKAEELKRYYAEINKEQILMMKDMDNKLTTRANLTNGNVSNIRKDLLELSTDIEQLYYYNDTHSGNGGIDMNVKLRQNAKKRKRRLQQIDDDRVSQEHPDNYRG